MEISEKQEIVEKIENLLNVRIRPLLQQDGGDVIFHNFTDSGELEVELMGACHSCPHAQETLKSVIEDTVKYFIPEVQKVIRIEP